MEIKRFDQGAVTVLRLTGDVDEQGVGQLRIALLDCIKERRLHMVVNLAGVRYISYLGIGVLIERQRQLRELGGQLRLAGLNLCAQRTFHMASVTSLFRICDTEAQAIEGFREAA